MRVLLPDLPQFRELSERGERSVPGVDLAYYGAPNVPEGEADGLVLWLATGELRGDLLSRPGLKWVLTLTAGIEHVRAQMPPGVALYNASRLHERAVAVHTLAGILAADRGLHRFRDAQRRGEWTPPATPGASGLSQLDGSRIVLWGDGRIAAQLRALLSPFEVTVDGISSDTPDEKRDELLGAADWVINLLPATERTRGLLNAEMFARFRTGAWLSNQGRGATVVTDDLLAALEGGHLGGAVLDVTDPEPLPPGHGLWHHENVILTPHIASTTADLVRRASTLTRDFLIDLIQGRDPEGLVEPWRAY